MTAPPAVHTWFVMRRTLALCFGAVLGPIAGLVVAPLAFVGAACALMSLVLACVQVHETRSTTSSISERA